MSSCTLMVQGCTSDAGKSTLVAALCRLLARRGQRVVPFKPQNMANNSAVTRDGGEIGRAQAVQAQAAGLEPHTDMNPVLLKPDSDHGCQVVVHGKVVQRTDAQGYHHYKRHAMQAVLQSYQRLQQQYALIVVEGAGSPAEVNLRANDVANMGFAEAVDCPVWLVADIERGGVFAHLLGTLECLSPSEQARIQGFIINRFRGDPALLEPGLQWLEQRTGKPVLAVLPYLADLHLEAEDSLALERPIAQAHDAPLRVLVPRLPRISNHTDLDPLALHPQVQLLWHSLTHSAPPPAADLVILPGSKSVCADLAALRAAGWEAYLQRHLRYGGKLLGICGGFQMLGQQILDPHQLEGATAQTDGLGWLEMVTTLEPHKQLRRVQGQLNLGTNIAATGYEIHLGVSHGPALQRPLLCGDHGADGAISADQQIIGSYWHGLFDHPAARDALLGWAGLAVQPAPDYRALREAQIERLADALEQHLRPPAWAWLDRASQVRA